MHDCYLQYPNCTTSKLVEKSKINDCGNPVWATLLFMSFNILSHFIFLNMIIGTIIENFSNCCQSKKIFGSDVLNLLTRHEIRSYKKIWSKYDLNRNGFIRIL